jgi:hypothetical protein
MIEAAQVRLRRTCSSCQGKTVEELKRRKNPELFSVMQAVRDRMLALTEKLFLPIVQAIHSITEPGASWSRAWGRLLRCP